MWIFLSILGVIAVLITGILLSPVKIIIRNNEQNELLLYYKFLFKTFGEHPNPDDPIIKALTSASGVDRLKPENIQESIRTGDLRKTVTTTYATLVDLLKQVVALLKRCTVSKLQLKILCAGEDADQAAIHYGLCLTATHSLLNLLRTFLKIRKKGCQIDVRCDFLATQAVFDYHIVLTVSAARVAGALWKVIIAEGKRLAQEQTAQRK